jgi:hypothetical protein
MSTSRKLLLFLHRPGFEALYSTAALAMTAGSCGGQAIVAPIYGGLLTLCGKLPYADDPAAVRSVALGLPDPRHMLGEGRRACGVKIVTTELAIRLAGLEPDFVRSYVDAITGLATLWQESEGAQVLYI